MTGPTLPIAVDAMGGDRGPGPLVAGARAAHERHGIPVLLVGDPERLGETGDLPVMPCDDVIPMDCEPARAVRRRKTASVVVAARAVKEGHASAMFSAGHTGATLAAALLRVGRIKGIHRPAVATPLSPPGKRRTILLDAGANPECPASWLVQFAQMGSVYASTRYAVSAPTIGLLTVGEEQGKGTDVVQEAEELLRSQDWSPFGARFVGNIEGGDLVDGAVDVAVTDGFTGNLVLKSLEKVTADTLDLVAAAIPEAEDFVAPLRKAADPDTEGGALLLGVRRPVLVGHGGSGPEAVERALVTAGTVLAAGVVEHLEAAIAAAGGD